MIAEDSDAARGFIRDSLIIGNHDVVAEACDGIEAVEKFIAMKPDLVLLDLAMPKKDALQVIKEIMNVDSTVKVILLTASGNLKTINVHQNLRQSLFAPSFGNLKIYHL